MDFDTLSTSKIKQKAWRVVQKSTLHLICYGMSMDIDLGRILGSGWEQFWFPIGFRSDFECKCYKVCFLRRVGGN